MKKTSIEVTSDELEVLIDIIFDYKERIWNIEDEAEQLKVTDNLNVAFIFLEKANNKFKAKKKFGKADFKQALIDKGCVVQDVEDWCAVRSVFTKRALDGFIKECESNNFSIAEAVKVAADKGWKGFEVKWLTKGGNEQYKGNNSTGNKPYTFDIGRASETLFSQGTGGLSTDKEG